jgi:predicted dienelactone hydrolase
MRLVSLWLILLAALLAAADGARAGDALFKAGLTTRDFIPPEPYDWRGAKTHALRVSIWYPASAEAREEPQWVGPPVLPFFSAGSAARDAEPALGPRRPLVLLSHGFGGMATDLAWLGTALARRGFIAAAVNHPGNNGLEDLTAESFLLMWLRAADLGAVIDAMLGDKTFGSRIDPARIGAAGHSFGGYTVITAAGGATDPARLPAFCRSPAADALCAPGPQMRMRQEALARLDFDPDLRQRYDRAGDSHRDERVRAVFAMAPGPSPALIPESLGRISIPVALVIGSADEMAPPASGAEALAKIIPHATLKLFPNVGHFVFVATCTMVGRLFIRSFCRDPDGIDRDAIHAETAGLAVDFFTASLR